MHKQHYNTSGGEIPSVTEIPAIYTKDMSGFQDWICKRIGDHKCCTKAGREYYQECADLGTDVHALREAFLQGETFDYVPEYQAQLFDPIARFYKESGYKPMFIEHSMTGKELGGSLDGAGTFAKPFWEEQRKTFWDKSAEGTDNPKVTDVWIEDLKIKSKIDPLHGLQLYGYSLLLKETKGIEAKWGLIIRRNKDLDKRPEIQLKGYYLPAYKEMWDASMLMWRYLYA